MESDEDLQELEVRLYSQVHHDAIDTNMAGPESKEAAITEPTNSNASTGNGTGNTATRGNRYWAKNTKPEESQHRKFVRDDSTKQSSPSVDAKADADVNTPEIGAIPLASGDGPEKERSKSVSLPRKEVAAKRKKNLNPFNAANIHKRSEANENTRSNVCENFNERRMRKKELNKKMTAKRMKSRMVRLKNQKPTETIVLESSDDEEIEVIPIPPPPTLTIDSSDEENGSKASVKSLDVDEQKENIVKTSRCNSPDDFIEQHDKNRLLTETAVPDDDELQCSVEDQNATIQKENFATPSKKVMKSARKESTNYEVTQSNFRAVDVYESESSDMPESIYGKAVTRNLGIAIEESDSDVEPIESVVKTKRLRKRKASGSNKGSEPNDDSTDSDEENSTLPFISRGEAVENCKQKAKKRQLSNRESINPVDREFMDKLSNIARGDGVSAKDLDDSHGSNISGEMEVDISARDIAENVLKQNQENQPVVEEDEAAIPKEVTPDMELFSVIDGLNTTVEDLDKGPEALDVPVPTDSFFEDLVKSDNSSDVAIIEPPPETPLNATQNADDKSANIFSFMKVVHTNRDRVAWNDEMVRFYDSSWGQEDFNLTQMLKKMNRNANWRIIAADRYPKGSRFSNLKCNNCSEFGHRRRDCPMPRKDLVCCMCGESGHLETRCPNTICLRCGRKARAFESSCRRCIAESHIICPICRTRGHNIDQCPDKWRRYHSTTIPNEHPNSNVFYNERKMCCICTRSGHLAENCRSYNPMNNNYQIPTSEIRYHVKTYPDVELKDVLPGAEYDIHLMCDPEKEVSFPFTKTVSLNQCYGRFLDAVDLYADPASKIVRNFVLNPFAGKSEKVDKKSKVKKEKLPKKTDEEDIQINVSGFIDDGANAEVDSTTITEATEGKPDATVKEGGTDKVLEKVADAQSEATSENAHVVGDTDSNYSFSEHFPNVNETDDQTSVVSIKGRPSVGALPDYIPINTSSSKEPAKEPTQSKERTVGPLPDYIPINMSDQDENEAEGEGSDMELPKESEENTADELCEGKIYLSKFHSQFLLSPAGTKFLIDASKEHSIKTSMDWTSAGNVLIIEGLTTNQDKFCKVLMDKMKNASDEKNRRTLVQSQKMPRSREAIVKLLEESLQQLEKTKGNVADLLKKMQYSESLMSKNSFKAAEKLRRHLNMMLMGQAGLREGQMHLSVLKDKLRELKKSKDPVTEENREELETHYRYIFSSFKHNNYDQLVRQYIAQKKSGKLPILNFDNRLIGKKVLNTEFTKEQKELLMEPPPPPIIRRDTAEDVGVPPIKTLKTEYGASPSQHQGQNVLMRPPMRKQNTSQPVEQNQDTRPSTNQQFRNTPQKGQRQNQQRQQQSPRQNQQDGNRMQRQHPNQQQYGRHQNQQQQQQHPIQLHPMQQQQPHQMHQQQHQMQRPRQHQPYPRQQQQQNPRQQYNQKLPNKQGNFNQRNQFSHNQRFNNPNTPNNQQQGFQQPMQNTPRPQHGQQQQPAFQPQSPFPANTGTNNSSGGGTFVANQIREINRNWNNRTDNLLNQVAGPSGSKAEGKGNKSASCFWSRECMKFIDKCMGLRNLQQQVRVRLNQLSMRASENMLSMTDYKAVKQIYYNLLKGSSG